MSILGSIKTEKKARQSRINGKRPKLKRKQPIKSTDTSVSWQRNWQRRNPEKDACHKATTEAINAGLLVREHCFCGAEAQAHHEDYSRPLNVMWLCPKHHKERHKQMACQPIALGENKDK